jgi:hypothetical protein
VAAEVVVLKAELLQDPVVEVDRMVSKAATVMLPVERQEALEALTVEQSMPVAINLQAAEVEVAFKGGLPETSRNRMA